MLALIYLGLAIGVGDRLSGRFFRYVSVPHRWATGALVGLLLSTGFTYLAASLFARATNPLLCGDVLFFAAAVVFLLTFRPKQDSSPSQIRLPGSETWDWVMLASYCALVCWMMFATLNFKEGRVEIGVTQWSDYGPNTAIIQNFAFGHNYPTEYPHFAGEPIRYHFLFYFLAGNLEFLGLNLAWSENIISILTMVSLLAVIMAFGELLFKSRAVGIVASALFFFHGTLSFLPFLRGQKSFKDALLAIYHLPGYLSSGYGYRGEDWGVWSQVVYINQRHLASSIGIFLIVLIFLFDRYLEKSRERELARAVARSRRPVPQEPTHGPSSAVELPTRYDYGEPSPAATSGDAEPFNTELQSAEQLAPAPETSAEAEPAPPSSVESIGEASHPATYAASEGHTSDALAYEQSPAEPETSVVSEAPTPARIEPLEESPPAANYASAGERHVSDTVAHDDQSSPASEASRVGEPEFSVNAQPVQESPEAGHYGSASEGHTFKKLAHDEQLASAPETNVVRETEPSASIESLEESSQAATDGSASETPPTFATRAYDEYMGLAPHPTLAKEEQEQEAEALEFVRESSQEAEEGYVSETEPSPTPVQEPVSATSRGLAGRLVYDTVVTGKGFIFCGLLLGALPYWNSPVFTAAAAVLACLFVLFPCRRYMVGLAVTAAVVALPQVLALRTGNVRAGPALLHWGYTLGNSPVSAVLKYIWWTFSFKWVLILIALLFFSWRNLRLFIAILCLFFLTFGCQFSDEILANHKFLNIWLVIANLFVAYGLWRLWHLRIKGWALPFRLVAILLASPIALGGIIDFFPIHNATFIETNYTNDRLIDWVRAETKPDAVFLSDRFVNHPILLAGRKIWFGYTYFTWSSGYDLSKREVAYKLMFESKNAHQVFTLLKANKIDYVAFDAGVRGAYKNSNEQEVYIPNFKKVLDAPEYWQLAIYQVPENADWIPRAAATAPGGGPAKGVSAFEGGKGPDNGQFDFPRGITLDKAGNILVADTNNSRIEKFSPTGAFISTFGKLGSGPSEFREPCGISVDSSGNIYVADVLNHRVQKLKPDGTYIFELKGPAPGFYGPRDVTVGPDDSVYVVDQGHSQIVKFDPDGKLMATFGGPGTGDGQFGDATSIAVDGKHDRAYVADVRSTRIEVFDTNGKYIATWPVPEWGAQTGWYFQDMVVDPEGERLYASSVATDEILVFDLTGNKLPSLKPTSPDKLVGCSSIALGKGKVYVLNTFGNNVIAINLGPK